MGKVVQKPRLLESPMPKITFQTNRKVSRYLEQLMATGLYGVSISDVVERIVASRIEGMICEGELILLMGDGDE